MKDASIKRVNRKGEVVCMMWHPVSAILACGWDDGKILHLCILYCQKLALAALHGLRTENKTNCHDS